MSGIPPLLYQQLQQVFLSCDEFKDGEHLRALFVIPKLRPFQAGLPHANNAKQRADQLIDYLLDRYHVSGENGLVLFVQLLSGRYATEDERHGKLVTLLEALHTAITINPVSQQLTAENNPTNKILHRFREHTNLNLPANPPAIQTIRVPIPQLVQVEALLQDAKPVLITGSAGVGKSGTAYELVHKVPVDKGVLLLDARRLSKLEHLQELRAHLDLDEAVLDVINAAGEATGCRLIIDQLDSVFETPCARILFDLALSCTELPGVEVVVIARNLDRQSDIFDELIRRGFEQVEIAPVDEATSRQILIELGIPSPPPQLIALATNLLNLDLISRIQTEQPTANFAAIDDEVNLWQYYLKTIQVQERIGPNAERADQLIDEAIRLAWKGLNAPERTVILPRPPTSAQQRLIDWDVIQLEHGLFYRFRHEKLHDFLAAKDAVDRDLTPKALMSTIDRHRTGSVVAWMDKLFGHADARYRRRFITRYLADENGLPFYTKLALLDRYLRIDITQEASHVIEQILQVIKGNPALRRNFFQAVPHYTWASELWNHGFFDSPPLPTAGIDGRYFLTHWDVQRYLIAVAVDAWHVVIQHVQSIEADGWYIRWAIEALCRIPPERAVPLIPRILNWLEDPIIAQAIDHLVYELMLCFARAKLEDPALALFGALITPILRPGSMRPGAWALQSKLQPRLLDYHALLGDELPLLRSLSLSRLIQILEGRLRLISALLSEHNNATFYHAHWRSAIEDSEQDHNDQFEDKILVALRDSLKLSVEADPPSAEPQIARYLVDNHIIFRRLGLHFLAEFPDKFPHLVANQLLDLQNLDNMDIHHELFMLLRSGFVILKLDEQSQLMALIQSGFPLETEQRYRQWFSRNNSAALEQEVESRRHCWIRDRLWMIRAHLTTKVLQQLEALIAQVGEPLHPEFLIWTGSPIWGAVQETSALAEAQIVEMSADELVQYLVTWSPLPSGDFLRRYSPEGLAGAIARVVSADPIRYTEHSHKVAVLHPVFAQAILGHLANKDNAASLPWQFCIELIELLLNEPTEAQIHLQTDDANRTTVRRAMIDVLERGLDNATVLPAALYPQVQVILFKLLEDGDPDSESDNPPADQFGYNDPLAIALNHIRPLALDLLIQYQIGQARQGDEAEVSPRSGGVIPRRRLIPEIAVALTTRLNPELEPSWGVRAVFGRRLLTLYWLDAEWTKTQLNKILPEEGDLQSVRFFMAAWDAFVVSYHYCSAPELLERLRPKYALAIDNLAHGRVTKSLYPMQGLAKHLVREYLEGSFPIDAPVSEHNLLRKFFTEVDADARARAAWVAWRFCADRPQQFWPRVKSLWAWRLQIAITGGDLATYRDEIGYFAQLPAVVHELESMASLRDLLTATLLYLAGSPPDYGAWEKFEEFLAHKVVQEPVAVIEFYQIMRDHQSDPYRFRSNDTRRKILTVAAEHEASRAKALALIDSIAGLGEHSYKDIYLRFA